MAPAPGKRANREAEILQGTLEVFHNTTGLQMVVEAEEVTDNTGHRADALLRVDAPGVERQFVVEIKPRLT